MSNINQYDYDHLRNLTIGTVDYVSPNEITEQCIYTDIKRLAIDPTGFVFFLF